MKKALLTLFVLMFCVPMFAQIADDQVIELIRRGSEQGLDQNQIATELMQRGVTQQQLLRIRNNSQTSGALSPNNYSSSTKDGQQSRLRTNPLDENSKNAKTSTRNPATEPLSSREPLVTNRVTTAARLGLPASLTGEMDYLDSVLLETALRGKKTPIFGHNIFNGKNLTFVPELNIATPENYVLGPGDEVIIDIWGDSEQTIRGEISPDGTVVIPQLGPVALGGLTVHEADSRLKRSLAGIYSSAGGAAPSTFIKLSLGQIRTIQVHVMGEVENPGTYTLPSLASLFHVLYSAGGVNDIGSLRRVAVNRGGARLAEVDIYSYLLEGRADVDITLKDGDIVVVPPWQNLVEITGKVKRPMKYEMNDGQSLASLLGYAGGFTGDAHKDAVTVVRAAGRLRQVYDVGSNDFNRFALIDADSISVGAVIDRFSNRLEITGAVYRPGLYSIGDRPVTIASLVERAGGLLGDAFTAHSVLTREKDDYSREARSVDVGSIVAGIDPDIELRNGDILHIPSIFDLREKYTVTVKGDVQNPGEYEYADNLSIEDMIVTAGGLLESASTVRVDVSRRIKNPSSVFESETRSETFSFPLRGGLVAGWGDGASKSGIADFPLKPFDIVTVRSSPGYEAQKPVAVLGEVLFPGDYSLVKREERLSDLMRMSGGALSTAYLQGAKLIRLRAEDELARAQSAMKLAEMGGPDSLSTASLNVEQHYSVGIELDKAMASPGSDYDLVLNEGDVLFVPGYVGTVAISGAVLSPNTVSYREGANIGYYIGQAGGYANRARKSSKFVIYMNGTIARPKSIRGTRITPGCEIVVPYKSNRGSSRYSLPEIMSAGASLTSAATLVTSIMNISGN
jgi:protein involved in polysaccharide export with SLBB domain